MSRPTADLIALLLAATVAVVVIATAGVTLVIAWTRPGEDISDLADAIGRLLAVLVGALVGYMAGRKINGNGKAT